MKIMELIEGIAAVLGILGLSGWGVWGKFIKPRLRSQYLKRLYAMIEEWFDEIDKSSITDLSTSALNNRENKIRSFIRDRHLEHVYMDFPDSFRRKFLKFCGIKEELCSDPALFQEYSRCPVKGLTIGDFWELLVRDFLIFRRSHASADPKTNFANVEMRVKLLEMFTRSKTT